MASRRKRKTSYGISDYEGLLNAIKEIKTEKKSIRSVADAYKIDRKSLGRYVMKFDAKVPDITTVPDVDLMIVVRRIASYAAPKLVCQ